MMKTMNAFETSARLFIAIFALATLAACSKTPLNPLVKYNLASTEFGSINAKFCTSAPSPGLQNLKYLFILDHSASNQPGFSSTGDVENTDASGSRRYGPLVEFVRGLSAEPSTNISYGLIDFNDSPQQPQGLSGFTSDATTFIDKVEKDWIGGGTPTAPAPNDSGFTNYQAALDTAASMITEDLRAQSVLPDQRGITNAYVVIFVSDGIPAISSPSSPGGIVVQDYDNDIKPEITKFLELKNHSTFGPLLSNVTLNTAYYSNGTDVAGATQLLAKMADYGNGQFLRFDPGQNILYAQFAPPTRKLLNKLVDVFVENRNLVWWDDGRLMLDSDGDGVPDEIETQIGSNSSRADSDGNGVSDLVEFRTKGLACDDPTCGTAGRDRYASCSGFSPETDVAGNVTFRSSTNDGLNDCEKFLLGASRTTFNTNGNYIPDAYAFRSGLPIVAGTDAIAFADPFSDGINNYSKLKAAMPVQVSISTLYEPIQQTINIRPVDSSQTDISCYQINVDNIPMAYGSNNLRMMVIQNSTVLQDKPFLLNAVANLPAGSNAASFSTGDFR